MNGDLFNYAWSYKIMYNRMDKLTNLAPPFHRVGNYNTYKIKIEYVTIFSLSCKINDLTFRLLVDILQKCNIDKHG